jgi:hypothetical protein
LAGAAAAVVAAVFAGTVVAFAPVVGVAAVVDPVVVIGDALVLAELPHAAATRPAPRTPAPARRWRRLRERLVGSVI